MPKYRWNYSFSWVVEFVRHDAEISLDIDGQRTQKVVQLKCATSDEAAAKAVAFCEQLDAKIKALIENETKHLKTAKP